MSIQNLEYDEIDRKIASILSLDAAITNATLGARVGLSASAAHERVRKLKAAGKIKKIVALIDGAFMDMTLCAFIFVGIDGSGNSWYFLKSIQQHPYVLECHHMTGEYSYMLKIKVANTKMLESFITDFLKSQAGIVKTMTHVVLSSPKESSVVIG